MDRERVDNRWSSRRLEYSPIGTIPGHTRWRCWLRHCTTSRIVAGSIPDDVIGNFIDSACNSNGYQEYFLEVKANGAWGWQLYHHRVPIVTKFGRLNLLQPSGPVQGLLYLYLLDYTRILNRWELLNQILRNSVPCEMVWPKLSCSHC